MPKLKKPKKCKCGETDQKQFYRISAQCKKCKAKYNAARYESIKGQREILKKSRHKKDNDRCIETPEMSVSGKSVFTVFCQKRREIKRGSGIGIPNCSDCGLGKKVDSGFLPVNIFLI